MRFEDNSYLQVMFMNHTDEQILCSTQVVQINLYKFHYKRLCPWPPFYVSKDLIPLC